MLLCGLGVVLSLSLTARWWSVAYRPDALAVVARQRSREVVPSGPAGGPTDPAVVGPARSGAWQALRSVLRQVALMVGTGVIVGLLLVGPAARLIMRLLAVTAGDAAQGRITEADEVVGAITVDGTIGLILFGGLSGGMLTALAWAVLRPVLPPGPRGGAVLGAVLLVVVGPVLDPLRADNPDFGLVGPGWVSLLTFGLAAIVTGMAVSVTHARLSQAVPVLDRSRREWLPYLPVVLLLLPGPEFGFAILVVAGLAVLVQRLGLSSSTVARRSAIVGGRVVVGLLTLGFVPGFARAVRHIAGT